MTVPLREAGIMSTYISGKTRLVTLRRNNSTPLPRLLGAVLAEFTRPSQTPDPAEPT
ncbi:hypothetical protein [Streptomyces sp. NPDC000880]